MEHPEKSQGAADPEKDDGPGQEEIGHDPFGNDEIEAVDRIGPDDCQV